MATDITQARHSGTPVLHTEQRDAKRIEVLSQAARLFNSKGSRATTLEDIAASLSLTKTSLYYYVKTKEELVYQCYMAALDHHHAQLDKVEAQSNSPGARCEAFLRLHFDTWIAAREGRGPHLAALMEIASLKGQHRQQVEQRYILMFKRMRQYLRDGIEQRVFRPCDTNSTTRALLGSVEWAFYWLHEFPVKEATSAADAAIDILSKGFYAGRGDYPYSAFEYPGQASTPERGTAKEEKSRLKQEAFSRTGTRFFNRKGFNGTSLDEIARELKLSKGAFYYHIKNKEDLLFNCYQRSLKIVEDIHLQAAQKPVTGLQQVEQVCRHVFHVQNHDDGPLIRYNSITALPRERRKLIVQKTEEQKTHFEQFLDRGIADGSIRPIDTFVASNLIVGAQNAAMDISLWRKMGDIDAAAIDYFDVFFNGLLPRPG